MHSFSSKGIELEVEVTHSYSRAQVCLHRALRGWTQPARSRANTRDRTPSLYTRRVSLAERRGLRMFVLCAMYVAQGIPWGFMAFTLPAILGAKKLDTDAIGGVMAMTTLPYTFKWAWGFLIDAFPSKRFGKRRPWIIFAQAMMAVTILAMVAIPDLTESISLLTWTVFVHTVFNSMQDVAVDALAVDLLDEEERGRTNGLMYAAKWGGGAIGGWGLSHVIGWTNLRTALFVQAAILFAIMLLPLLVKERDGEVQSTSEPAWRAVPRWFRETFGHEPLRVVIAGVKDRAVQSALLGGVVMLLSNLGVGLLAVFGNGLFTQQLGWKAEDYASLLGGPGLLCGLLGSVTGGFLADRVGHRRLAGVATLFLAADWFAWSQLSGEWGNRDFVYAMFWMEPFFTGVMTVSLFALCMDISWPAIGASQFALYMATSNFSTTTGYKLAGYASKWWSNSDVFLAAAVIQASFVLVLPFIDPRAARDQSPRRQRPERRSSSPA